MSRRRLLREFDVIARLAKEATTPSGKVRARIAAIRSRGPIVEPERGAEVTLMQCKVCGMMVPPGKMHYPWGDKDRGPKHKP